MVGLFAIYWESGGRYQLCFGKNYLFEENLCRVLQNDWNYIYVAVLIAWSLLLSLTIYFLINERFKKVFFSIVRNARFVLITIFLAGFVPIEFCLGFLGCSTVYLWPFTLPLLINYLLMITIFAHVIHKKSTDMEINFSKKLAINFGSFVTSGLLIFFSFLIAEYLADIKLPQQIVYGGKIDLLRNDNMALSTSTIDFNIPKLAINNRTQYRFLVAEDRYVKVAVLNSNQTIVKPSYLGKVDESDSGRKISNKRDYFIDQGYVYAGFHFEYPFSFFIEGINTGVTKIELQVGDKILARLERIPILLNTHMYLDIEAKGGSFHVNKLKYDLEGDGVSEKEISWAEPYDAEGHIKEVLDILVRKSLLSAENRLELIEELKKEKYGNFLVLTKEYDDKDILIARELVSSDLIFVSEAQN